MSETYRAPRYTRTPRAFHSYRCPDKSTDGHFLVPIPSEGEGVYVCPYAYDQERSEAHRAQIAAEEAAERQERAEKIAANTGWKAWPGITPAQTERVLQAMTAAALRGMTETENAK